MPKYTSKDDLKSGLPLGGIGAGKLEVFPNGALDYFTFLNNFDNPLTNSIKTKQIGVLGFCFGLKVKNKSHNFTKLLQTIKIKNYENIEEIKFRGNFPFAHLEFFDKELPLKISLEASSFFIPHDVKNSSLPQASFIFKIENKTKEKFNIALVVIARNIVGNWLVGRFNKIYNKKDFTSLNFYLNNSSVFDSSNGELSLSIPKNKEYLINYFGEFNIQEKPFIFNKDNISLKAWEYLQEYDSLPNINTQKKIESESVQLAGSLAIGTKIAPKEKKEIPIHFSWYFPKTLEGHFYQKHFKNSKEVFIHTHKFRKKLLSSTLAWQKKILDTTLVTWLKDALINNLYPFFSSSLFTKNGLFSLLESPQVCPLLGTLDVRFYASIATLLFFPELELKELMLFAKAQRSNGYIPHDLGLKRFDLPSNSTNAFYWKDLNSKFILMAYRDYLWTKDKKFLKGIYPSAKRAFEWIISTDKNQDYLPDDEGEDQTFDLWSFYGTASYTSSIFLASLLALKKMADILNDSTTKKICSEWFNKGRVSFENKLWQGKYFICYNDIDKKGFSCTLSQLTGQWYAHLLDLGYIVDAKKVKKAISQVFSLNAQASKYGAVNSVFANKRVDNTCSHSQNVWIGINYAFCSLAIYEGFVNEALSLAKKVWDNICKNIYNPWNQPDMVDAKTGKELFGDHYMRNMVIWAIPLALSKNSKKIKELINFLKK